MRKKESVRQVASVLALVAGFIAVPCGAQQNLLRILSPSTGTVVHPGQTITIAVAANASVEKLALIGQRPLGVGQIVTAGPTAITASGQGDARPMQFVLRVPAQTQPGIYRVTAMGRVSGGDLVSEALTIDVEKAEEPVRIWTEPSLIRFEQIGDQIPVRVLGAFPDGSNEELTKSTKTTFTSADPHVATISADGMAAAVGPGKTSIQIHTPLSDYSIPVRVQ